MRFDKLLASLLATGMAALPAGALLADDSATPDGLSLELIMQDPDWIGPPPVNAWWHDNGGTVYYQRKREGETFKDTYALDLASGESRRLENEQLDEIPGAGGAWNAARTQRVYERNGDIFVYDVATGIRQLTRTAASESDPFFMADQRRIAWQQNNSFYIFDPATGLTEQAAEILAEDDPAEEKKDFDYLEDQQTRLFSTLRETERKQEAAREQERKERKASEARLDPAIYIGADKQIISTSLSPAGRYLIVVTKAAKYDEGKQDAMPNYVTDSGYMTNRDVRTLVGLNAPAPQSLHLVDVKSGKFTTLDLDRLPGIKDDPFDDLRDDAIRYHVKNGGPADEVKKALEAPKLRSVTFEGIEWTRDGRQVAVQAHAIDNKDRWIATVDFERTRLDIQHRLHDDAWINWYFNEFGWLPDNKTLWYLSEESGYSHLYVKQPGQRARQLTEGEWVVSSPAPNANGSFVYFIANRENPGRYQIFRVPTGGGNVEQLTRIGVEPANRADGSLEPFYVSPDETQLLFKHDSYTRPPELYVQAIGKDDARQLTRTTSEEFLNHDWKAPEIVKVPSSHVKRPIYTRVYTPENYDPSKKYPGVVFVHGAGYLQNVHEGWSGYFREFMFHNILLRHGYVVIDMDYRASAGYGRDWRTSIYRQMGHPELEDLLDGVDWMVKNRNVDPERVGIYGGSYGGFMTFMALFRAPGKFAAGASLRPVTDWMHYNHEYTSNILNTPLVDPAAYENSSPIEFAPQYDNTPMLIAHGMQDDNVFFKDSVRLVQRLIELKKENFEIAPYPLDPHGFKHAESWLDEYRRIFKLFEEELK